MIRKIKDKSGASLMLALLVFLICAMVGSSVLAAATASTGVVTTTWSDDADVYAMKSAAEMFNDAIAKKTTAWTAGSYTADSKGLLPKPSNTGLDDLRDSLCIYTYNNGAATETLTMTIKTKTITAVVTMDASYNIKAVFTTADSSRKVISSITSSPSEGTTTQAKGASVSFLPALITIQ